MLEVWFNVEIETTGKVAEAMGSEKGSSIDPKRRVNYLTQRVVAEM